MMIRRIISPAVTPMAFMMPYSRRCFMIKITKAQAIPRDTTPNTSTVTMDIDT